MPWGWLAFRGVGEVGLPSWPLMLTLVLGLGQAPRGYYLDIAVPCPRPRGVRGPAACGAAHGACGAGGEAPPAVQALLAQLCPLPEGVVSVSALPYSTT